MNIAVAPRLSQPRDVDEVLHYLDGATPDTKLVAGGTAVMLMLRNHLIEPDHLIALSRVSGMDYVNYDDTEVRIGALTTLLSLERSAVLHEVQPTLSATVGLVANHRVRHRATIGGNLAEADYASDPPAVLATLGCRLRLVRPSGERVLPLTDFLVDFYETALMEDELVVEVAVDRVPATARTTYLKYVSRSAEDRPCVGVAAYLDIDTNGLCRELRVAVSGAMATPFLSDEVADACRGSAADDDMCRRVGDAYGDAIDPIDDGRGSSGYRKTVTAALVRRALSQLVAGQREGATRL